MPKSRVQRAKDWLTLLFLSLGFIYLVLGAANRLSEILSRPLIPKHIEPSPSELATIFFGASSLGLIMFSLLLAAAAIIEWQSVKGEVKKVTEAAEASLERVTQATQLNEQRVSALDARMEARNSEIEKELRGRVDAVMGAMIGVLHSRPDEDTQDEERRDYVAEAVHHIRAGYDRLKELEGRGRYMALNNLVYFTCLLGDVADRDEMVKHGRDLLDVGRQYRHLPSAAPYLMTYCRVVFVYISDRDEIEQALAIAQELLERGLTKLQRKEATYLVTSLTAKLKGEG